MLIIPGSDPNGAVSSVSVMDVGTYAVPATPLIAPFPSFMTKGSGSTFSTFARDNLQTCTPGYYARSLLPASTSSDIFVDNLTVCWSWSDRRIRKVIVLLYIMQSLLLSS